MNTTDVRPQRTDHSASVEVSEEIFADTGGGLRIAELAIVALLGLLACPPFVILAVVVAVPIIAISAVVAAVAGCIAASSWLVRRVRAHHRDHGSTLFLHRLRPRRPAGLVPPRV
jgi:hypothetical protein